MSTKTAPVRSDGPGGFSDEELDAFRQEGDPLADDLASKIFGSPTMGPESGSRLGYNKLVDIADVLEQDSELLLLEGSNFVEALRQFPEDFQDYYHPIPCPDWVDEEKLEIASELWKQNSLAMLGMLYAASLPACYLMKNGIPALYQTAKLKDSRYVFQRIYETGLMLDSVMSPGGLKLVHDLMPESDKVFLESLEESAGGEWEKQGDQFVRVNTDGDSPDVDSKKAEETANRFRKAAVGSSFIWGRGYIAAKKVRMLHASMRFMLMNPGAMKPRGPGSEAMADKFAKAHGDQQWPADELGVPVNQEDLAFTLLTFSYLIPRGMEKIGIKLSDEEKEAFLHLWRVVGHIMGVREDLMTDNWEDAKNLYDRIHRLQAGSSPDGIALTEAVMGFLKCYLPNAFGISKRIPVALIGAQMGSDAELLLSKDNNRVLKSIPTRLSMFCIGLALRFFGRRYERLIKYIPIANRVFGDLLFQSSELIMQSWRDEYTRKPFYVPLTVNTWVEKKGVDDSFREKLQRWRQRLFVGLASALLAMGIMFTGTTLGIVFLVLDMVDPMKWSFIASLVGLIYAVFEIDVRIPKIFGNRPVPAGVSQRGKPAS